MFPSTTPTRTPPELKWLLNERAALHGRAIGYAELQRELSARVLKLEAQLQTSRMALAACAQAISDLTSTTAALDATMELGFPQANPAAAGAVRPHTRYGVRGALTNFLQEQLRLTSPRSFTAAELGTLAKQRFGLVLLTRLEIARFGSTLRRTLMQIRDGHGTVERISVGAQNQWRWKQAPTLDDLRRMAERSSMSEEDPPHERAPHPNTI